MNIDKIFYLLDSILCEQLRLKTNNKIGSLDICQRHENDCPVLIDDTGMLYCFAYFDLQIFHMKYSLIFDENDPNDPDFIQFKRIIEGDSDAITDFGEAEPTSYEIVCNIKLPEGLSEADHDDILDMFSKKYEFRRVARLENLYNKLSTEVSNPHDT